MGNRSGPAPGASLEGGLAWQQRGPQLPRQMMVAAALLAGQSRDQGGGMGDHPHLGAVCRSGDAPRQGRQQVGMQAVFGFVEHQQGGNRGLSRAVVSSR